MFSKSAKQKLVTLADSLDKKGFKVEADMVDRIIREAILLSSSAGFNQKLWDKIEEKFREKKGDEWVKADDGKTISQVYETGRSWDEKDWEKYFSTLK